MCVSVTQPLSVIVEQWRQLRVFFFNEVYRWNTQQQQQSSLWISKCMCLKISFYIGICQLLMCCYCRVSFVSCSIFAAALILSLTVVNYSVFGSCKRILCSFTTANNWSLCHHQFRAQSSQSTEGQRLKRIWTDQWVLYTFPPSIEILGKET